MTDSDERIDREIEQFNEETDSAAELPGRIRVNLFRYARAFPHRVLWWVAVLGLFVALGLFIHYGFFVLAVPVLVFVRRHWTNIRGHFLSGCLNAGKVVSIDPPLIAVSTSLGTDPEEANTYPVLKVLPQPLSMLVPPGAEVGRRVVTVALYDWQIGDRENWSTFHPMLVDVATGNEQKVRDAMDRLDDEDWADLEYSLAQVGPRFEPGLYRIYDPREDPPIEPTPELIRSLLDAHVAPCEDDLGWYPAEQMPPESLEQALGTWANGARAEDVIALIDTYPNAGAESGFLVTAAGVWFGFDKAGHGFFPWRDLRGTHLSPDGLEITLFDGRRLHLTLDDFLPPARDGLDRFFAGLDPTDW